MEKGSWWVEALLKKYLNGQHSKILTDLIMERPCTQAWRLIRKVIPQIKNHISKIPGNGKDINLWTDRIMGSEPRSHYQQYRPLKNWMEVKILISLHDISVQDQNYWSAWKDLPLPNHLKNQWANLKIMLIGAAPTNKTSQDSFVWDPSEGKFTLKVGYQLLQSSNNLENWNLQLAVWKN